MSATAGHQTPEFIKSKAIFRSKLKRVRKEVPADLDNKFKDIKIQLFRALSRLNWDPTLNPTQEALEIQREYFGHSEDDCHLYIVISCHKGVASRIREEASRPHIKGFIGDFRLAVLGRPLVFTSEMLEISRVYTWRGPLFGATVVFQYESLEERATIGGTIEVHTESGKKFFALTVSHFLRKFQGLSGPPASKPYAADSTTEFRSRRSTHDDVDLILTEDDIEFQEDASSVQHPMEGSIRYPIEQPGPDSDNSVAYKVRLRSLPLESSEENSVCCFSAARDWFIFEVTAEQALPNIFLPLSHDAGDGDTGSELRSIPHRVGMHGLKSTNGLLGPELRGVKGFPTDVRFDEVTVYMLSKGAIKTGLLTNRNTSVLMSPDHPFVDIYSLTLDLDSTPFVHGDSGAWVVNSSTGVIYGHIFAINSSGVGMVMPIFDTLGEIWRKLSAVAFPALPGVLPLGPLPIPTSIQGTTGSIVKEDNLCTPENSAFYKSGLYQPLNNEAREIRLLAIPLTQQGQEQLELRLEDNIPLAGFHHFYFAISYAAGDHTKTEAVQISVDDKKSYFNAFSNLTRAVRRVRDHGYEAAGVESMSNPERAIWADQICINQSDPDERAYQVEHMREIYQAARLTIIYLGEDEHDGRGIKYLKSIADYCREGLSLPSDNQWNEVLNQAAGWIVDHVRTPDHAEDWRAVRAILKAPWWQRGWVCQEAIVSNDAVVLHGSSSMQLPVFIVAVKAFIRARRNMLCEAFEQARSDMATVNEYFIDLVRDLDTTHVEFILQGVQEWAERNGTPFDDIKPLLRYARNCQTGDPRDRVYAFIGLADPAYGIKPSYKLTTSETFANTAACIMIKDMSLEVVFDAMDNSGMPNLPSWAANWLSPQQQRSRYLFQEGYSASADYPGQAEIAFPGALSGFCGPVLRMQVLRLGRLSVPERFGRVEQGQEGDMTSYKSWEKKAGFRGEEIHDDLYIGGGRLDDAFVSTLLFGGKFDDEVWLDDLVGSQACTTSRFESTWKGLRHNEAFNGEWCFFVTAGGYMGLAISKARHDDYLCIGLGASVPLVLRSQGDCYSFIGEAYVQGMMHGEAIKLMDSGDLRVEEVNII